MNLNTVFALNPYMLLKRIVDTVSLDTLVASERLRLPMKR